MELNSLELLKEAVFFYIFFIKINYFFIIKRFMKTMNLLGFREFQWH